MAYPISTEVKDLFRSNQRQTVLITFSGTEETLEITDADIPSGGFSINRYCSSGNQIEIGSAVAGELRLNLNNFTGKFNSVTFGGAELYVRVGIKDWSDPTSVISYIPFGYFTVDQTPKVDNVIQLSALDRMVLFDKTCNPGTLPVPCKISDLLSYICTVCNVSISSSIDVTTLPNANYIVQTDPVSDDITYRQILSWIAEVTGTCAFIDWNGELVLKWYTSSGETIDKTLRYSSDVETESITITGVQITTDDTFYLAGEAGYILNIEGNSLIQSGYQTIVASIFLAVGGFSYYPATISVEPSPQFWPLDTYINEDKDGNLLPAIVSNITFELNKNTTIEGKGETETEKSYARQNPLTKRERVIIETLEREQNAMLNTRAQEILRLNELICNSTGLYRTTVAQADGSEILYLHDAARLEQSQVIFTMGASGFAWTESGWNGGSPVWKSGVTAAGEAFFRLISTEGIKIGKVGQDYHIEITPSAFQIFFREMLVTEIEEDTMSIPRMIATDYVQVGRVRIAPHDPVGADFIFVD